MNESAVGDEMGGRYQLLRRLGEGMMGCVWEGRDLHLERPVAVKTVAAGLLAGAEGRSRALARFHREAKAAARLDHPNVTTVYDADVIGDTCWLVMQLVDGTTLEYLFDAQPGERFDVATAACLAAQLCAGLSAVHQAGLVHRDLKPENVMVRQDGLVKVLDFGLVKVLSEADPALTRTGESVGNLVYASPELLTGADGLDSRSDLYALGCLLHHMLAGTPPFPARQPALLVSCHLDQSPPPVADSGVDIPEPLQGLLSALLAKSPLARPSSCAEVYAALVPYLPAPDYALALRPALPEDPRRPFLLPQGPRLV
ncbi:serine/threonine-protein kinase [Streptomyces sp. TR06-5]|uniref:serine/threonine-protein kinase n=1 Tax=Streptomyces sp. TR06-5 TaxID=3385976 RepID=UPI00399FDC8D